MRHNPQPIVRALVCFLAALGSAALASPSSGAASDAPDTRPAAGIDTTQPVKANTSDRNNSTDLTVAILDFDSTAGNADLGKQIGETLTAALSGEPGFTLVDRATLARTLQENELNLTGLVDANQANKIGKLVGARILITGRVFPLDKQLFLTAKIIGTETSLVEGVLVKGDKDSSVGDLLMKLSEKVATRLREAGPKLVAQADTEIDPVPALKKFFAGKKLPKVSIEIQERHVTQFVPARIDPAVETEIRSVFGECGFKIIDGDANQQADADVKLKITGEGFSEFAARIGDLVSCVARVEVKVSTRESGKLLYSDRETTRAVDLAENIAGKTALQKAGRILGIRILQHLRETMK